MSYNDKLIAARIKRDVETEEHNMSLTINRHFNNHMYSGSAIETDDNCGNCNGGMCDYCNEYWTVGKVRFNNIESADEYAKKYRTHLRTLCNHDRVDEDTEFFLNEKDELVCELWDDNNKTNSTFGGYSMFLCNTEASLYKEKYEEVKEKKKKWEACPCEDKDEGGYQNSCNKMGCNDSRCYDETQNNERTERKWYP